MLEHAEPLNLWLYVRDLTAARRFYSEQLGLPLWREEPTEALHYGTGGILLSLRAGADGRLPPRGASLLFTIPSGIDEACEELQRRGVVFEQKLADRSFGRSAMFRDPDGHELWVCQPSATETQFFHWTLAHRNRPRPIPSQRPRKARRHERRAPSRRRAHPEE